MVKVPTCLMNLDRSHVVRGQMVLDKPSSVYWVRSGHSNFHKCLMSQVALRITCRWYCIVVV